LQLLLNFKLVYIKLELLSPPFT